MVKVMMPHGKKYRRHQRFYYFINLILANGSERRFVLATMFDGAKST
jgi:hypothetical protein